MKINKNYIPVLISTLLGIGYFFGAAQSFGKEEKVNPNKLKLNKLVA